MPDRTYTSDQIDALLSGISAAVASGASPPFSDNAALVKDDADATKLLRVDVGTVASGTTRVLTMPNADVNLTADQAAGTASLRTLGTDATQAAAGDHTHAKVAVGAFRARQTTAQTGITSGAFTKVNFQTEDWDANSWFDSTTNYRYTPQIAGLFQFGAAVHLSPAVVSKRIIIYLYKNGSLYGPMATLHTSTTNTTGPTGSIQVKANGTTDYFEVYLLHDFGVNTSDIVANTAEAASSMTAFWGVYLGS